MNILIYANKYVDLKDAITFDFNRFQQPVTIFFTYEEFAEKISCCGFIYCAVKCLYVTTSCVIMKDSCGVQTQFSCESFWYSCKAKAHLRNHKRVHMEKKFLCSHQCGFKTQYKYHLALHNRIHSGERPFVCTHNGCTYSSSRSGNLVAHQLTHSKLKPFKCNLCGKCFRMSSHLNCHIRTHTGEKPYKCLFKDCNYSSTQASNLQKHFNIHTGEKPYRCSYEACEYSFRQKNHLKRHMMTHKDGKVYTCSFKHCRYSSIHESNFKSHTNRVHIGKKRHACQLCEYRSATPFELKIHVKNHEKALKSSISHPRLNSSSSSSLIEVESAKTVSNSKLIKSLEVDEDPKLSVRTFVRLTRLKFKNCNCCYKKDIPDTITKNLETSRDPTQKTKSRPGNSASPVDDPKLRIPAVVVLERLQVNYDSDDAFIVNSLRAKPHLTIPAVSKCTEIIREPQTGPKPKPWKASLYTCKICDYETKKFKKYKSHLQSHREKREFFCPLCDFVGFKKKLLKFHLRTHDNDSLASDSGRCSNTQSHHARVSITGQKAPPLFDNTSVKTNCVGSQNLQNKEIQVQQNPMVRIAHSHINSVQLQESRTKRNQSPLNPNRSSQAKKLSPESSKKKRVFFSCIFCNKVTI